MKKIYSLPISLLLLNPSFAEEFYTESSPSEIKIQPAEDLTREIKLRPKADLEQICEQEIALEEKSDAKLDRVAEENEVDNQEIALETASPESQLPIVDNTLKKLYDTNSTNAEELGENNPKNHIRRYITKPSQSSKTDSQIIDSSEKPSINSQATLQEATIDINKVAAAPEIEPVIPAVTESQIADSSEKPSINSQPILQQDAINTNEVVVAPEIEPIIPAATEKMDIVPAAPKKQSAKPIQQKKTGKAALGPKKRSVKPIQQKKMEKVAVAPKEQPAKALAQKKTGKTVGAPKKQSVKPSIQKKTGKAAGAPKKQSAQKKTSKVAVAPKNQPAKAPAHKKTGKAAGAPKKQSAQKKTGKIAVARKNQPAKPSAKKKAGKVAVAPKNQSDRKVTGEIASAGIVAQEATPPEQQNTQNQNRSSNKTFNSAARPVVKDGLNIYVEGEALIWQAEEDNLTYIYTGNNVGGQVNRDIHSVDFNWDWGFRVGIGYNAPRDGWDLNLYWTHIQNRAHGSKNAASNEALFPVWSEAAHVFSGTINSAQAHWNNHLDQVDLQLGREFYAGRCLRVCPFVGVRSDWIFQKYKVEMDGTQAIVGTPLQQESKLKSRFWGFGFVAGFDTTWMLKSGFSLYGDADIAVLMGFFDVDQNATQNDTPIWRIDKSFRSGKTIVDLGLGFKWSSLFCNDSFGLTLKAGYEYHLYFNQNQFTFSNGSTSLELFNPVGGDLSYQGAIGSLQFDF